ncbi:MAG: hypothetical protein HY873_05600 [Chloroflexi bacterium]|nr:hypothetical protein [Chloroflexota bacterium]
MSFSRTLEFINRGVDDPETKAGISVRVVDAMVAIGVWIEGDGDYDIGMDGSTLDALIKILEVARQEVANRPM